MGKLPRKPIVKRMRNSPDDEKRKDYIKRNPKSLREMFKETDIGEYERICREGDLDGKNS